MYIIDEGQNLHVYVFLQSTNYTHTYTHTKKNPHISEAQRTPKSE